MSREQLARVFPDGRTVLIPSDGKPLPGYALALADIKKQGNTPSQNSLEAARTAGINVDTMLASNERPAANPFAKLLGLAKDEDEEDDSPRVTPPAPVAAAAPAPVKHPVLAAIEHGAQTAEKATAKAAVKVADAASKVKFIRTADASPAPTSYRSATAASTVPTPKDIVASRGYWQGPADAATGNAANAAPDSTGSIGPFANPRIAQGTPELALAYADQPGRDALGIAALRAAALTALASQHPAETSTTIAVKRGDNQSTSAIMTASATSLTVTKTSDARLINPWMRAIVLSPSVRDFLTTLAVGARDFRSLAPMMVKPSNSVLMAFAADPNPGLDNDRFSGTAIVFISTVSYPTRTASLQ